MAEITTTTEPDALAAHVRICAGVAGNGYFYRNPQRETAHASLAAFAQAMDDASDTRPITTAPQPAAPFYYAEV